MQIPLGYRLLGKNEKVLQGDCCLYDDGELEASLNFHSGKQSPELDYVRPIDNDWHENPGVLPVHPDQLVDVEFQGGQSDESSSAVTWRWSEGSGDFHIARYRVSKVVEKPLVSEKPSENSEFSFMEISGFSIDRNSEPIGLVRTQDDYLIIVDDEECCVSFPVLALDSLIQVLQKLKEQQ